MTTPRHTHFVYVTYVLLALSLLFLAMVGISGCAQIAANDEAERQTRDINDNYACLNLGAEPGSQNYYDCRIMRDDIRIQAIRSLFVPLPPPVNLNAGRSPPVNCTTSYIGAMAYTNCY